MTFIAYTGKNTEILRSPYTYWVGFFVLGEEQKYWVFRIYYKMWDVCDSMTEEDEKEEQESKELAAAAEEDTAKPGKRSAQDNDPTTSKKFKQAS